MLPGCILRPAAPTLGDRDSAALRNADPPLAVRTTNDVVKSIAVNVCCLDVNPRSIGRPVTPAFGDRRITLARLRTQGSAKSTEVHADIEKLGQHADPRLKENHEKQRVSAK